MSSRSRRYGPKALSAFALLMLAVGHGCFSFGKVEPEACSRHDECAPGSYCVERSCVAPCSGDDDCAPGRTCQGDSELPSGVEVCLPDGLGGAFGAGTGGNESGGDGDGDMGGDDPGNDEPLSVCTYLETLEGDDDQGTGGAGMGGGEGTSDRPPSVFARDSYGCTEGGWEGLLFTFADDFGGWIVPQHGELFTGEELCVHGETGSAWEGFGMLGFNIAHDLHPSLEYFVDEREIAPGGSGVLVEVQNNLPYLELRVQLNNLAQKTWCATIPPGSPGPQVIAWGDFQELCWEGTGSYYDGSPISAVFVQAVSNSSDVPTPFDFCVINLGVAF